MSVHFQRSHAGIFVDAIVSNSKVKRTLPSAADVQSLQRKSPDEALRLPACWKPRGPHLHGHPLGVSGTAASSGIHQQIPEPPCSAAVRQSHTEKPDLITALDG